MDEDGCKGSWDAVRNIGAMHVFLYVAQKCAGPLWSEVWKIKWSKVGQKSGKSRGNL